MAEILSYRDLDAWKVTMDLAVITHALACKLPSTERFELSAQLRRAAVSIPSNVAEGQAAGGRRYLYHVRIALGSLAEVDTQLELTRRLGLLSPQDLAGVNEQLARAGQLLHGLARGLKRKQIRKAVIGSAGLTLVFCVLLV